MNQRREPIPFLHPKLTCDREICESYASDASGLCRIPDGVARPESEAEIVDLVRACGAYGTPLTPQGLRSSTTGSSVVAEGMALSLEGMSRVIEIDPDRRLAVVEPGVVLGGFKRQVRDAGLFYPPDPTSEEECTLGGTVATNASGSRSYRYGPTRRYVREIRVVLADGTVTDVRRVAANKNATGYYGLQNPIDIWIGSEGTLGLITRITVDLLPAPLGFFSGFAFFPDWKAAIRFVQDADTARHQDPINPRCLELFDRGSLDLLRSEGSEVLLPADAGAAIFFEEEGDPNGFDESMICWASLIERSGGDVSSTKIARTEAEQLELRRLRHAIPAGMVERGNQAVRGGGRRISTDFAVQLEDLPTLMADAYRIAQEQFGGMVVAYGHVGNGHPHFGLVAEDPEQLVKAERAAHSMARRARELDGTLSAEHGIGKVKRKLFRELYPDWVHDGMRSIKAAFDPKGIFSPGNLFE